MGTDLSPIQPGWVPPNVRFMLSDVEDGWGNGFDYDLVHFRSMAGFLRNVQNVCNMVYQSVMTYL